MCAIFQKSRFVRLSRLLGHLCYSRVRSVSAGTPNSQTGFTDLVAIGLISQAGTSTNLCSAGELLFAEPRTERRNLFVSVEFLSADISLSDPSADQHLTHAGNHLGRARNVVDRNAQIRNPF